MSHFPDLDPYLCTSSSTYIDMRTGSSFPFGPTPPPSGTKWGGWVTRGSGESQAAADLRFEAGIGHTMEVVRVYDFAQDGFAAGTAAFLDAALNSGLGTREIVGSLSNLNMTNVANHSLDSTINSFLTSVSSHVTSSNPLKICLVHEIDHKVNVFLKGQGGIPFTGTGGYVPAQNHFVSLIAAHGDSNIIPIEIFVGASLAARTAPGGMCDWSLIKSGVKGLYVDPYQGYLGGSPTNTQTASQLVSPMYAAVQALDPTLEFGIGEIGYLTSDTAAQAVNFMTSMSYLEGIAANVCYFNGGGSDGDTSIVNTAGVATPTGAAAAYGTNF